MLQVGPRREVYGGGEAVVVEAEEAEMRETIQGPSGAGKVQVIENEVSDSAMAAADTEPGPGTGLS